MNDKQLTSEAKIKKAVAYYAYACFAKSWNGGLYDMLPNFTFSD